MAVMMTLWITWSTESAARTTVSSARTPILVVGDSVVAQSAAALVDFAPPGVSVSVGAALGTAPCDWENGSIGPHPGEHDVYEQDLRLIHPRDVVLLFTGNPGLSGPSAGCLDPNKPYSLTGLLRSYRIVLDTMAKQASAIDATVYLERPPPRNPAVPTGYDIATRANRGFQGVPAIAQMLEGIVASASAGERWIYADGGARAISGPGFVYEAWMPCSNLLEERCFDDEVLVRASNNDAIHLDPSGCGAILFSIGIESQLPIGTQQRERESLQADRQGYKSCR
jgi:hypothetical protein